MANIFVQISVTERQILHIWLDHPEQIESDMDFFISETAREFQEIFITLQAKGFSLIEEHILKESIQYVHEKEISALFSTEYQIEKYNDYKTELVQYKALACIKDEVIKEISDEVNKKGGTKNIESLKNLYNKFGESLALIEQNETSYLSFHDMLENNKVMMDLRSKQMPKTTGCFNFDRILSNIFAGIGIIVGYSGSMKSTVLSYLAKQRIIKRLPTVFVNTELTPGAVTDGMVSEMIKVPYYDILGISRNEDLIDYSAIMEEYNKLEDHYEKHNTFLMYPGASASIQDLVSFFKFSRKEMQLKPEETLFAYVDLLSMIKDFSEDSNGNTRADSIEVGLNVLNAVCLELNIFLLGTVQLKRMPTKIKIDREEDIEKFRPSLDQIKSSGAWEERARILISIHNPYHICMKNPCSQVIRDLQSPIIELTVLKDNYTGKVGDRIFYHFNSEYKSLLPYEKEEE